MLALLDSLPLLCAMAILIGISAFFSASEAALFSLRAGDRRALALGNRASRIASELLKDPDRLLSAILFWNLVVNIAYFALASIIGIKLEKSDVSPGMLIGFTAGALLTMIFLSEMLPKSFAVLKARSLSAVAGIPLSIAVRAVDPLMPTLRVVNLLSRRLIWPSFSPEPYLQINDLERAIKLSTTDAQLIDQEQRVLRNVVSLSDLRVDECMRPRASLMTFRPPVALRDIKDQLPPDRYLLITEPDSDEVASAIDLTSMTGARTEHLEYFAEPVLHVPWCATVAALIQRMETKERDAAAVVNEIGETIGLITRRDILELVFSKRTSRSERLLNREPIQPLAEGLWLVTGMTNLRKLEEYFEVPLPETHNVTVAGVLQETLQRLPAAGDRCEWGPFEFSVTEVPANRNIMVHVRRLEGDTT